MADDGAPKKRSILKWVLLLVILLLLIGGGAAAWFLFLQDMLSPSAKETARAERVEAQPVSRMGLTVPLSQFTSNLADPLGQRFIRINMSVEVADARVATELGRQDARVRDSILMLLASKSWADLATTEGRLMLRSEITDRLNIILGPGRVHQVFITDMVVQ